MWRVTTLFPRLSSLTSLSSPFTSFITSTGGPLTASQVSLALSQKLETDRTKATEYLAEKYDVVFVGAGHNALVCANYLAKKGKKVLVLEKRHLVGGAAVSEELYKGFLFSRCSYLYSLFRPFIVSDLGLKNYGLELLRRDPPSFTPLVNGNHLYLSGDASFNANEIRRFSEEDAAAYVPFSEFMGRLATAVESVVQFGPPDLEAEGIISTSWAASSSVAREVRKKREKRAWAKLNTLLSWGQVGLSQFPHVHTLQELFSVGADRFLKRWFHSEPLLSTLATDAIIGAAAAPSSVGSGYVLLHHFMGGADGEAGVWAYVRGGMGSVSNSLAASAIDRGVRILVSQPVSAIVCHQTPNENRVVGVQLEDGKVVAADVVVSNATPHVTLGLLTRGSSENCKYLREERRVVGDKNYQSPVTKINLALSCLPQFRCLPKSERSNVVGPQHRGTIHLNTESLEGLEKSFRYYSAYVNQESERSGSAGTLEQHIAALEPLVELTLPSSVDRTVAPEGTDAHVAQLFVQYTPYGPYSDTQAKLLLNKVLEVVDRYCEGFSRSVLYADVLTPDRLERTFGLTGGNIFHGAMSLDQIFLLRAPHRSPSTRGLFYCGAGTHPGGGVMGAAGYHCAKAVLSSQ